MSKPDLKQTAMKPNDRYLWIRQWLEDRGVHARVDVLDAEFVNQYVEATGADCKEQFFGAPKCAQLGRDLGHLFKIGVLKRYATGLPAGDSAMGFPKWVWSYQLSIRYRSPELSTQ